MEKKKYEDFSLALALTDALPVIFFSAAMILIALRFDSILFVVGAVLCSLAGLGKVTWKIIIASTKKDVTFLNRQLRVTMPLGFTLIIVALFKDMNGEKWAAVRTAALSLPAVIFFSVTVISMVLMSVFAFTLDQTKARSNRIEQTTNALAQFCFLLGVCFCLFG